MVVSRNSPTHSPSREKPVSKKNLGMASVQWTGLKVLYSGIPLSWASQVANGREPASQCRRRRRPGFNPWVRKIPWSRKRQPTPVFLPGESFEQRSLAGYSPWGRKESDTTERLNTHRHMY